MISQWRLITNRIHPVSKREIKERGYRAVCERLLAPGPFNAEAKERIIRAVTEHSKKDDELGDSDLSVALRSADKIDRFAPSMLPGCGTCNPDLLAYDDSLNPFWGGEGTREGEVKTQYEFDILVELTIYSFYANGYHQNPIPHFIFRWWYGLSRLVGRPRRGGFIHHYK
ncbi:MAG: hypothetical protein Q7R94_02415 [bacterium]|nr:hypothetical protein [bacterium]